ncbi:amidase [Conexibacter woesei]|uniref:amidase n=1 Tax=Conexibacter woesei TaxID=191495 RepID=UPI000425583D|nr:amidase [Conexibacter woesei]
MSTQPSSPSTASPDLWRWSASALAAAIHERQVSASEAVEASLARIAEVNGKLNALVDVPAERAREQAAEADRAVASGAPLAPLHGVPVSIKDNVDEAGLINSGGVPAAVAGGPAAEDAPVVANLRAAGAISVGRSNVPAFSLRWFSDNDLHGRTLNPFDDGVTPGGSSGGAASAVASGMVPIAHGNDIGGSVRYPAHVCGVMGLRPTVGRIASWTGPDAQVPGLPPSPVLMAVEGVLARTAGDLDLGLRAMSARADLRDPACIPAPFARRAPLERGATLALFRGGREGTPVDDASSRALDVAAGWLREAGFGVEEIDVPQLAEAHRLWLLLLYTDLGGMLPAVRALGGEAINTSLDLGFEVVREAWGEVGLETYIGGHVRRTALIAEMQALLTKYPALIMPAGAVTPPHDADLDPALVGPLMAAQWPNSSVPLLGFPALTLPTGIDAGLPTGVQLLGGRFGESALLDVAEAIELSAPALTPIDPKF